MHAMDDFALPAPAHAMHDCAWHAACSARDVNLWETSGQECLSCTELLRVEPQVVVGTEMLYELQQHNCREEKRASRGHLSGKGRTESSGRATDGPGRCALEFGARSLTPRMPSQ